MCLSCSSSSSVLSIACSSTVWSFASCCCAAGVCGPTFMMWSVGCSCAAGKVAALLQELAGTCLGFCRPAWGVLEPE
jgi:hypothetical protein